MRIDRNQSNLRLCDIILIRTLNRKLLDSSLGSLLHLKIKRRIDLQAILVDSISTVLFNQDLGYIINEIRSQLTRLGTCTICKLDCNRLSLRGSIAVDILIFHHLTQNYFLASLCGFQIIERRIVIRTLRNTCKHRTLRKRQLLGVFIEIRLSCSLDTISTLTEIDLIQIHLKDLILCILTLNLESQKDLLNLTLQRTLLRQICVFGKLLCDRAATLGNTACSNIDNCCTHNTDRIDAAMIIEASILYCDKSILQILRHLIQFNRKTIFLQM